MHGEQVVYRLTGDYANSVEISFGDKLRQNEALLTKIKIRTPSRKPELDSLPPPKVHIENFSYGSIDIGLSPGSMFYCGDCRQITLNVKFIAPGSEVRIHDGTSINEAIFWCYLGNIEVGADCMFSEFIKVYSHDQHALVDIEKDKVINSNKCGVTIHDHVWVGRSATILPSVEIGKRPVVGAGSIVTKNVPENSVVAGNPTRVVRKNTTWSRSFSKTGQDYFDYVEKSNANKKIKIYGRLNIVARVN